MANDADLVIREVQRCPPWLQSFSDSDPSSCSYCRVGAFGDPPGWSGPGVGADKHCDGSETAGKRSSSKAEICHFVESAWMREHS